MPNLSDAEVELLKVSQQLLDSIDSRDWASYARLCDVSLTCREPEAFGHLVTGMPFHEFYFRMQGPLGSKQSTISSPHVRIMGDAAVVTYVRLGQKFQPDGSPVESAFEETRIWQKQNGEWKHVHFHRSKC